MKRRDFLKAVGATSGIGVTWNWNPVGAGPTSPVHSADAAIPRDHVAYLRSTCTECPAGCGVLAKVVGGHVVKLEGDPDHPVNHGGLCIRGQASLSRLYHPERLRNPRREGKDLSWDAAFGEIREALTAARDRGETNLFLAGRTTGSLVWAIDDFCGSLGLTRLPEIEIYHHGALRQAYGLLYDRQAVPYFQLRDLDLLVSFGADLFETFLSPVRFAHEVAHATRRGMHWVHLEPHLSLTGSSASHRLVLRPGTEAALLSYLLREITPVRALPPEVLQAVPRLSLEEVCRRTGLTHEVAQELVAAVRHAKRPLILSGGVATGHAEGMLVAVLTALLQEALGATGRDVLFSRAHSNGQVGTLEEVRLELEAHAEKVLGVVFVSRCHAAPAPQIREGLAHLIRNARCSVALTDGLLPLPERCQYELPVSHALESTLDSGCNVQPRVDLRCWTQPVVPPLHDTMEEDTLLQRLGGSFSPDEGSALRRYAQERQVLPLRQGYALYEATEPQVRLRAPAVAGFLRANPPAEGSETTALVIAPSVRTYDGRSRSLPLLSEIPDPVSAQSYASSVRVPVADGGRLGLEDGDNVEIQTPHGGITLPARLQPGQPEGIFSVLIDDLPDLAMPFTPHAGEFQSCVLPVTAIKRGGKVALPILSGGMDASGRGIVPGDESAHGQGRGAAHAGRMYDPPEHEHYRWAMAIDLERCTGCSACVAACYVENNIALVGSDEHLRGREMSWLRIQPYLNGNDALTFVPVMCQHCSSAPCETVCPVYATYHTPEGLNAQVYNRCVGTRYCANNCPYKARRFNWFKAEWPEPRDGMLNPDVSVRPAGVMEKCTFCVQRIRAAKDHAKDEGRSVRDREFLPACAQSCPTQAIVFGNLLDKTSQVYKLAHSGKTHRILEALGTEPAVYYLSGSQRHES